jgi:hypothetical protein
VTIEVESAEGELIKRRGDKVETGFVEPFMNFREPYRNAMRKMVELVKILEIGSGLGESSRTQELVKFLEKSMELRQLSSVKPT